MYECKFKLQLARTLEQEIDSWVNRLGQAQQSRSLRTAQNRNERNGEAN